MDSKGTCTRRKKGVPLGINAPHHDLVGMHTYCCTLVPFESISDSKLRVFSFVADERALEHNRRWPYIEAWADTHDGLLET